MCGVTVTGELGNRTRMLQTHGSTTDLWIYVGESHIVDIALKCSSNTTSPSVAMARMNDSKPVNNIIIWSDRPNVYYNNFIRPAKKNKIVSLDRANKEATSIKPL